jgi:endonuclease-3
MENKNLDQEKFRRVFFERLRVHFPDAEIELDHCDPFTLLIATMLSARCTDKAVNKVLPVLFANGTNPQDILSLGELEISNRIKSVTFYKTKAKRIIGICKEIIRLGRVPHEAADLESLPGVGRKTANIVRAVAFGQITFPVDTHVFRVSNRTGLAEGKNVKIVEEMLIKRVPAEYACESHVLLILHGRYTCKQLKPRCSECPVSDLCQKFAKDNL